MDESVVAEYERHYMGDRNYFLNCFRDESCFVEGRYSIEYNSDAKTFVIIDLFHTKRSTFPMVITTPILYGALPAHRHYYNNTIGLFPLNLNSILVIFITKDVDTMCLGLVKFDHERSLAIVDQAVFMPEFIFYRADLIPQSPLPNLYEGLILYTVRHDPFSSNYLKVKLNNDHQLEISQLDVTLEMAAFGCFDGLLYGLNLSQPNAGLNQPESIDLIKYSISTGEHVQERTTNYEMVENCAVRGYDGMPRLMCCIGKTLFVCSLRVNGKQEVFSLNLETLEWRSTNIRLTNIDSHTNIDSITTHENGTLLVTTITLLSTPSPMKHVFRFVFNEPDKLSDLSWLQLKRIFDARPSAYEFILSQLPKNFKQKCPLPPQ